tara:strand:- start:34 stop:312 length:279 start_codon:yes stop_codon:yes gene_type:complete
LVVFFLQFDEWNKRWEDLHNDKPDYNEEAAGIAKVQAFGWFGTLDVLAKEDPIKYDAMLKQEAITIYTKIFWDKTKHEYSEALQHYNSQTDK